MHSIHPLFLISLVAFLLPLYLLSILLTVTLTDPRHFFVLAFFLLLSSYMLYLFRHLLLYIRYFP